MQIEIKPLNSKSILDCDAEEFILHNKENEQILKRLEKVPNYHCLMVSKYQDIANKDQKMHINHQSLADVKEVEDIFGLWNGIDLFVDEDNFLSMMIYGDYYIYEGETHVVTLCIGILPLDENRNFIDISDVLLDKGGIRIADEQFAKKQAN